jgi:hypothetical protein
MECLSNQDGQLSLIPEFGDIHTITDFLHCRQETLTRENGVRVTFSREFVMSFLL